MFKIPTKEELLTKPFQPVAYYHRTMDFLYYLERDCSVTSQWVRGSNVELLRDNGPNGQLVGVQINGFSQVVKWDVLDAIIAQYPWWFKALYFVIRKRRIHLLNKSMKRDFPFLFKS